MGSHVLKVGISFGSSHKLKPVAPVLLGGAVAAGLVRKRHIFSAIAASHHIRPQIADNRASV